MDQFFLYMFTGLDVDSSMQVQNLVLEVLMANLMVSQSARVTVSYFFLLLSLNMVFAFKSKLFLALSTSLKGTGCLLVC